MNPWQLRKAIEDGIRAKAPETVRELQLRGKLKTFLDERLESAMQEIEAAESAPAMTVHKGDLPYLERVQRLNEIRRQTEGAAIANAIEASITKSQTEN